MKETILWRGVYSPGHEHCSVYDKATHWFLEGVAVFIHERQPCRLEYLVQCDQAWNTQSARVSGYIGDREIDITINVEPDQHWLLNGTVQPAVSGCTDIDLNFSPSTNLLPIRRLNLPVGQAATVGAAWLRFPSFALERLDQLYHRLDQQTYRYESNGGKFVAELKTNAVGLVTSYPGLWEEELATDER